MCEEAGRLLGLYTSALLGFHRAEAILLDSKAKPDDGEFTSSVRARDTADRTLQEARRRYWDHVREHGCREAKARAAAPPVARPPDIDILWRRLEEAKKQMDRGYGGLDDAREFQSSGRAQTADGQYLYQHALRIQEFAVSEYLRCLADLKAAVNTDQERNGVELLTQREVQVLRLIASGKTGREIGEILGIAFKTVTVHRHRIYSKLQVHKTADLVRIAMRAGLIAP